MSTNPIARTALFAAAARAVESRQPDRLFHDPLAEVLAGEEGPALLAMAPPEANVSRAMAIRTRFFDDWLDDLTRQGVRQVVLVAAGMDTRAFRLIWPADTRLWEMDQPAQLMAKREMLDRAAAQPCCDRREVGVDLTGDAWPDELRRAGFRPDMRSVWLLEGLLFYFTTAGVERLLGQIARLAAPGSRLGADIIGDSLVRMPWMQSFLHWCEEEGFPWRFTTDRPEDVVAACGWRVTAVRQPGEDGIGAGLLPWPVAPREVPDVPRTFLVTAER